MRIATTLGAAKKVSLALLACSGMLFFGSAPAAAEQATVPDAVSTYSATELVPRLTDLYGPGADGAAGIDFTHPGTVVGEIVPVMEWTAEFREGAATERAVQDSGTWVAPVSRSEVSDLGEVSSLPLGVALVWISPYTNVPELANFIPSDTVGPALVSASSGAMLIHDETQGTWFSLTGTQLTPLAQGEAGLVGSTMSLVDAQKSLWLQLETLPQSSSNQGFVIAGLTLAFVVVLLAVFVLIPDRRRSAFDSEIALGFPSGSLDRD